MKAYLLPVFLLSTFATANQDAQSHQIQYIHQLLREQRSYAGEAYTLATSAQLLGERNQVALETMNAKLETLTQTVNEMNQEQNKTMDYLFYENDNRISDIKSVFSSLENQFQFLNKNQKEILTNEISKVLAEQLPGIIQKAIENTQKKE